MKKIKTEKCVLRIPKVLLMEMAKKQNLSVNIVYSKVSGEFRHTVVYSEKSIKVLEKEFPNINLIENKVILEFHSQKDAVEFCEHHRLAME